MCILWAFTDRVRSPCRPVFRNAPRILPKQTGWRFLCAPASTSHRPSAKEPVQIEHFNDALVSKWKLGKVEEVVFKGADEEDVQMWVVYPPDFDAKKKWPLVQVVHGGPHNGITTDFSFRWNLQLWAAQGYVIGCVNFHGSSGFG